MNKAQAQADFDAAVEHAKSARAWRSSVHVSTAPRACIYTISAAIHDEQIVRDIANRIIREGSVAIGGSV